MCVFFVVVVAVKPEAIGSRKFILETIFKRNQQLVGEKGDTIRTKTRKHWTC